MGTDGENRIYEFEEKPKAPKSNTASMGVYVFNWDKLKEYLETDEADPASTNDFGRNVLPAMLNAGERMFAYRFSGYWKDVGTVESLWEANMDLLKPNLLNLGDASWRVYSRNPVKPPHYVAPGSCVRHSMLTEGSAVYGFVEDSVIFHGVRIGANARVRGSIVMPDAVVGDGAVVEYAVIGEGAMIGPGASIGVGTDSGGIAVVGSFVRVGGGAVVPAAAVVEEDIATGESLFGEVRA
jgi:glucose-1-phosphate adenylyltransferase